MSRTHVKPVITLALVALFCGTAVQGYAQDLNQLPHTTTVWHKKEALSVLEEVAFFVAMNADARLRFDRTDDTYMRHLAGYLDITYFANEQSAVLNSRNIATFILNHLVRKETLDQVGLQLIDEQKSQGIQELKKAQTDISELIGKQEQQHLITLDEHYDHLIVVLEGLIAMGAEVRMGSKKVSWDQTHIPRIMERIKAKKAKLATSGSQTDQFGTQ